ncbi:Kelch domain-containing protein 3 [Hondaea fermentalgiana]|uniref:Kelch domain-containing protein 3 n=1 Tax=Hondaea fermentalgiana TaxID=2315210 RepID=A0A2R5GDV1_9STRA|nr:Kelch domain-containing protein 3 [Hondaea fermentalgiana]|eukprot:GBG26391.1 Kelch domain-containing protein 3 [Hondaea fermentalgiana]
MWAYGHLPSRRSGATGVVLDGSLYVFGGYDGRDGNYFNDLYRLNFATLEWTFVRPRNRTLMDVILEAESQEGNQDPLQNLEDGQLPANDRNERVPQPRTDHSMVAYDHRLVVFGGYDGAERFNNTFEFDTRTLTWRELCVSAQRHQQEQENLLLEQLQQLQQQHQEVDDDQDQDQDDDDENDESDANGGEEEQEPQTRQREQHMLHVEQVETPSSGSFVLPTRRFGHSGIVHDGKLWIFGGWDGRETLDCTFALDLETERWSTLDMLRAEAHQKDVHAQKQGNQKGRPEPFVGTKRRFSLVGRTESSTTVACSTDGAQAESRPGNRQRRSLWDGLCQTLAGSRRSELETRDRLQSDGSGEGDSMYMENMSILETKASEGSIDMDDGRDSHHTTVYADQEKSLDFGRNEAEIHSMDVDEASFGALGAPLLEARPENRYRHSAVVCGSSMFVFGGVDKEHQRFHDVHRFDFSRLQWEKMQIEGVEPSSRTFHRAVCMDNYMYVLGGYDGENRLNDMHRVFVGPLSPAPLMNLCAAQIRSNADELVRRGGVFEKIAPMVLDTVVWTRDSCGFLRAGRRDKTGKIVCTRFTPKSQAMPYVHKGALETRVDQELEICSLCNGVARQHELVQEALLYNDDSSWQPDTEDVVMDTDEDTQVENNAGRGIQGPWAKTRRRGSSAESIREEEEKSVSSDLPYEASTPRRLLRKITRFRTQSITGATS